MFEQSNHFNNSNGVLKHSQIEALKSLSMLLVREITSLEGSQEILTEEVGNGKSIQLPEELQRIEAEIIRCALIRTMGKQNEAARLLGLKITTLNGKIKRYKIDLTNLTRQKPEAESPPCLVD